MDATKYQKTLRLMLAQLGDLKEVDAELLASMEEEQVAELRNCIITARNFIKQAHNLFEW